MAHFLFAACQRGAEKALEAEVHRLHPDLKAAYRRPGLVTFKAPETLAAGFALAPTFARAWGHSLGMAETAADVAALAAQAPGGIAALHVFARDRFRPGEEPPAAPSSAALAAAWDADLRQSLTTGVQGGIVLDVVVPPPPGHEAEEASESALVGWHRPGPEHSPYPGGRIPLDMPPDAPSWAYRKLEEALVVGRFEPHRGDVALDLGAAPGGASFALVRRGVHVTAVDPQAMDPAVELEAARSGASFRHLALPMSAIQLDELPSHLDWLLLDAHVAPQVALHGLQRYLGKYKHTLKGAILTLKLNTWDMADEIPGWLERLRALGLVDVEARQLPSNRQEVCVIGRGR